MSLEKMTDTLSHRELEVLKLIISEYTTPEIAEQLGLSKETVKTHRRHLLEKMEARNVAGLVRRAFEANYVLVPRSMSRI